MDKTPINAPPCVRLGEPLNPCARARYEEQILKHLNLTGDWNGWKFRGRDLVSPDGERISPERLRGILYKEKADKSKRHAAAVAAGNAQEPGRIIRLDSYRKDKELEA
ncbi:MAG: hypothetical protein IT474_02055 [Arenimonas sp.]|nr:hypothetical protein [Arenimonas sp.]